MPSPKDSTGSWRSRSSRDSNGSRSENYDSYDGSRNSGSSGLQSSKGSRKSWDSRGSGRSGVSGGSGGSWRSRSSGGSRSFSRSSGAYDESMHQSQTERSNSLNQSQTGRSNSFHQSYTDRSDSFNQSQTERSNSLHTSQIESQTERSTSLHQSYTDRSNSLHPSQTERSNSLHQSQTERSNSLRQSQTERSDPQRRSQTERSNSSRQSQTETNNSLQQFQTERSNSLQQSMQSSTPPNATNPRSLSLENQSEGERSNFLQQSMQSSRRRTSDSISRGPFPIDNPAQAERESEERQQQEFQQLQQQQQPLLVDEEKSDKKFVCFLTLTILVMIGSGIGLTFSIIAILKAARNAEQVKVIPNPTNNQINVLFPRSKAYINDQCKLGSNNGSSITLMNRTACEAACSNYGNCCSNIFSTRNSSCYESYIGECYSYVKCHFLTNNVELPPAPNNLEEICSTSSIIANRQGCEQACEPVRCCYDSSVSSCLDTKFEICLEYSYCQNLRNGIINITSIILPVAPSNLDQQCFLATQNNPNHMNTTCLQNCFPAAICCNDPMSDCYRNNFIACLSHATCKQSPKINGQITVAPMYQSNVPARPSDIISSCSAQAISSVKSSCEGTCGRATCCWNDNENSNCFGNDPFGCLDYSVCSILGEAYTIEAERPLQPTWPYWSSRFPQTKDEIEHLCDPQLISSSPSQHVACSTACLPYMDCCDPYSNDTTTECYTKNFPGCYNYANCYNLLTMSSANDNSGNSIIAGVPTNISTICSPSFIIIKRAECENVCSNAKCCWDSDSYPPCTANQFQACQAYIPCHNLNLQNNTSTSSSVAVVGGIGTIAIPAAPAFLDIQCSVKSTFCTEVCQSVASCCSFPGSDCYRENFMTCLSYGVCPMFWSNYNANLILPRSANSSILTPPPANLAEVCDPNQIRSNSTARLNCINACTIADCCFTNDNVVGSDIISNCFDSVPFACLGYASCQGLVHGSIFPRTKNVIDSVCRREILVQNVFDRSSACRSTCQPFLANNCCDPYYRDISLESSRKSSACYSAEMAGCYSYSRCHAVGSTSPAAPSNLYQFCSPEQLSIDSTACEEACVVARCCWDFNSTIGCIDTSFDFCLDYGPCQNLRLITSQQKKRRQRNLLRAERAQSAKENKYNFQTSNSITSNNSIYYEDIYDDFDTSHSTRSLLTTHNIMSVAPDNLDQMCRMQSKQCLQACYPAANCCSNYFSDCYRDNFLSCLSYASCNEHVDFIAILNDIPQLHSVLHPSAVDKIAYSRACDRTFIEKFGMSRCRSLCSPVADCCWKSGNGNCFGKDPLGCMEYINCKALF